MSKAPRPVWLYGPHVDAVDVRHTAVFLRSVEDAKYTKDSELDLPVFRAGRDRYRLDKSRIRQEEPLSFYCPVLTVMA